MFPVRKVACNIINIINISVVKMFFPIAREREREENPSCGLKSTLCELLITAGQYSLLLIYYAAKFTMVIKILTSIKRTFSLQFD